MSGLPTPRREEPPSLAPEIAATVNAALADLERCAMEARVVEDRYGHWFDAQAHALRAFHRLFVDGVLTITAAVNDAHKPTLGLTPDGERELAIRVGQAVRGMLPGWRQEIHRKLAVGVGVAGLVLVLVGFGSGYVSGKSVTLATCQGGSVQTSQDGRRYCAIWIDQAPGRGR